MSSGTPHHVRRLRGQCPHLGPALLSGLLDNRLLVTRALHQSIIEKFRAVGITIAFPQRDVHLSAAQPLDVRIHQGPAEVSPLSGRVQRKVLWKVRGPH